LLVQERKISKELKLLAHEKGKVEKLDQELAKSKETMSHVSFKPKLNAHSMCAQESSLHTYHTENGYRITNVSI
jgi:hypothetical protein